MCFTYCPPMQNAYKAMYKKSLQEDIVDDTSGVEKEFFLGLINVRMMLWH